MCDSLAELEGSLWPPPLLSDCSPRGAPALLFRAVIGQGPPTELVCSSFVAPRFRSLLKASLWRDAASAASPSSFTLLRPHTHTRRSVHRLPRPCYHDAQLREGGGKERELGGGTEREQQRDMFNRVWGTLRTRVTAVGPELHLTLSFFLSPLLPSFHLRTTQMNLALKLGTVYLLLFQTPLD